MPCVPRSSSKEPAESLEFIIIQFTVTELNLCLSSLHIHHAGDNTIALIANQHSSSSYNIAVAYGRVWLVPHEL